MRRSRSTSTSRDSGPDATELEARGSERAALRRSNCEGVSGLRRSTLQKIEEAAGEERQCDDDESTSATPRESDEDSSASGATGERVRKTGTNSGLILQLLTEAAGNENDNEKRVRDEKERSLRASSLAAERAIALYAQAVDAGCCERDSRHTSPARSNADAGRMVQKAAEVWPSEERRRSSISSGRLSDSFGSLPSILEHEDEEQRENKQR